MLLRTGFRYEKIDIRKVIKFKKISCDFDLLTNRVFPKYCVPFCKFP